MTKVYVIINPALALATGFINPSRQTRSACLELEFAEPSSCIDYRVKVWIVKGLRFVWRVFAKCSYHKYTVRYIIVPSQIIRNHKHNMKPLYRLRIYFRIVLLTLKRQTISCLAYRTLPAVAQRYFQSHNATGVESWEDIHWEIEVEIPPKSKDANERPDHKSFHFYGHNNGIKLGFQNLMGLTLQGF